MERPKTNLEEIRDWYIWFLVLFAIAILLNEIF